MLAVKNMLVFEICSVYSDGRLRGILARPSIAESLAVVFENLVCTWSEVVDYKYTFGQNTQLWSIVSR